MNESQRAAALRLADSLEWLLRNCADPDSYPMSMSKEAAALLRELASAPAVEPEPMIDGWPLYSGLPPPQQQRKPLTDEQINDALDEKHFWATSKKFIVRIARAVEKAHGIVEEA